MPRIECRDISKRFGGLTALAGVSLTLDGPGIAALIGPNGAGKSTLLNVISGHAAPESGTWAVNGQPASGLPPERLSRLGLGRTFQTPRLIKSESVVDNVLLALGEPKTETLLAAMAGEGLRHREHERNAVALGLLRDVGLDEAWDRVSGSLSFGQQKLLALVCCIAVEPTVVLLDEPVAGVDPAATEKIESLIRQTASRGARVIFVEHDLDTVRALADEVFFMAGGQIVLQGDEATVLGSREVVDGYLG